MHKDVVFALISIVSHLGIMCAVGWHLLRQMQREDLEEEAEGFDEGGGGGGSKRLGPTRPTPLGGGGVPLPEAAQSGARLREPGRIADRRALPERRRGEPVPRRVPAGD